MAISIPKILTGLQGRLSPEVAEAFREAARQHKLSEMKKALLITGAASTNKTHLAFQIARGHKIAGGAGADFVRYRIPPGTEYVILEEISEAGEMEPYLEFIGMPIHISKAGEQSYSVSPFFIFLSQSIYELPKHISKYVAHLHLTSKTHALLHIDHHHGNLSDEMVNTIHQSLAEREQFQACRQRSEAP